MIDLEGIEWLPVSEAAARAGVKPKLVYTWLDRRVIRAHRIGRRAFVSVPDVLDAEHAWRHRERGGHRHATRKDDLA